MAIAIERWQTCYCRNYWREDILTPIPTIIQCEAWDCHSSYLWCDNDTELWSVAVALNRNAPSHYSSVVTITSFFVHEAAVKQYYPVICMWTVESTSSPQSFCFSHDSALTSQSIIKTDTASCVYCINTFVNYSCLFYEEAVLANFFAPQSR